MKIICFIVVVVCVIHDVVAGIQRQTVSMEFAHVCENSFICVNDITQIIP